MSRNEPIPIITWPDPALLHTPLGHISGQEQLTEGWGHQQSQFLFGTSKDTPEKVDVNCDSGDKGDEK